VLRKIFGPKREEDGSWRKLHNDELHSLYSSRNIVRVIKSRRMRCAEHVARMGEGRGVYRLLVGRPEGKRPLGRPRRRWEDNITTINNNNDDDTINLQEIKNVIVGFFLQTDSCSLRQFKYIV
jgi:hypothetical protein